MTHSPTRRLAVLALPLTLLVLVGCARLGNPDGWSGGVLAGEVLYIGTEEGQLVALDRQTGVRLWDFELLGEERDRAIYGTPAISGDTLYVGGYDGFLYVFNVAGSTDPVDWNDPVLLDHKRVGDPLADDVEHIVGGPAVVDEDCSDVSDGSQPCQLVMVGSSDGAVYTFEVTLDGEDSATILERRRFETGGKVWSTPAVANGVAYFGSLDHKVYAIAIDSGDVVWEFETGGGVVASPIIVDGRVYVGSFDSIFYAFDAADGSVPEWRFTGAGNWYWGAAVANSDTVFAPSLDGNLYALELRTGKPRWVHKTDNRIVGAPALISDLIAVASDDGRLRIASLDDGNLEGACTIEDKIRTPLVAGDGTVYLGARDNTIRALSVGTSGDIDEEWVYQAKDANALDGASC